MRAALLALLGVLAAQPAAAFLAGSQPAGWLGFAVGGAGDVDGDGRADVVAGALLHDGGAPDEGRVFVLPGTPGGVAALPPNGIESDQAGARLGSFASGAGDVNGDGRADVAVGAEGYDGAAEDEGVCWIFHGSAAGIAAGGVGAAAGRLSIAEPFAGLGFGDARAGDVNGDGYGDVVLGARFAGGAGAAFVFHGSVAGVGQRDADAADARIAATAADGELGASFASAGDVNGDGFDDVIVGAPEEGIGGAVHVFHGGVGGIVATSPAQAATRLASEEPGTGFGYAVAGAGDFDGDGFDDVVIGAPRWGPEERGAAFVFRGSAQGIADGGTQQAAWIVEGDATPGAHLGAAVAGGDLNGDGRSELVLGAPHLDGALPGAGGVLVARRAANASAVELAWTHGDRAFAQLGSSVAIAGDVDGDGRGEWVAGAPFRSDTDAEEGALTIASPEPNAFGAGLAVSITLAATAARHRRATLRR